MGNVKEQVLREFGDEGADTLERYFVQIEYAAYWCIRMLVDAERIEAVIPEGIEDVVVVRYDISELHQIKTRDESQGPWTTADVLPVLCQQYHRRKAFSEKTCFHFASNQMADNKTQLKTGSYGPLYRLKNLLDVQHDGQCLNSDEQIELYQLQAALIPRIKDLMLKKHQETIDDSLAIELLYNTWIDTDCHLLRKLDNPSELQDALLSMFPSDLPYTLLQLREIYDRLVLLVVRKVIRGRSCRDRQITREDVLNCRTLPQPAIVEALQLDQVPGATRLDKKTHLGGFDLTEVYTFRRQKALAEGTKRELESLNLGGEVERLTTAILNCQRRCRHKVCREQGIKEKPGPHILAMVETELLELVEQYFPSVREVDEQFCLGILWKETNLCQAWWHGLDNHSNQEAIA